MQIPRPTEDEKKRFRDLVPDDPRVEVKPMFGNLGAFVNGNMFMGLFGSDVGVKLDPLEAERARQFGAGPFGPAERPMGGFVSLPPAFTPPQSEELIARALAYVAELPPKKAKPRKR